MDEEFQKVNEKLLYKTIKEGVGELSTEFQEIYFFYICRTSNGNFISGSQSTATKCVIGRNQVDPNVEIVLRKMQQGQRVLVRVVQEADYIEYEIEIIRFGRVQNLPWQLEGDEKYAAALKLKNEANNSIKQQDYKAALNTYQKAIRIMVGSVTPQEIELITQLRSNLCLAALKLTDYERCIYEATLVLENDPRNVKVLHRRAVAHLNQADYDKAEEDLKNALQVAPQDAELKKELEQVALRQKKQKDKQSAIYKKMLFGDG